MIVTAQQMKVAEADAFAAGATPMELMEVAGEGIANCIGQFFPDPGTIVIYCGKGHNGGDALVAARHLIGRGWRVLVRLVAAESELEDLTRQHLRTLQGSEVIESFPKISGNQLLLLDGLLGIGSQGTPRGAVADLILEMNTLRKQLGGYTIAVDLPSGLDATKGVAEGVCVQADLTVTIGAVKSGLVADTATPLVGRLALLPLPGLSFSQISPSDSASISNTESLRALLPTRDFDSYKGTYGRIGILAGSVLVALTLAVVPSPYVVEQPGPVFDTLGTVTVNEPVTPDTQSQPSTQGSNASAAETKKSKIPLIISSRAAKWL